MEVGRFLNKYNRVLEVNNNLILRFVVEYYKKKNEVGTLAFGYVQYFAYMGTRYITAIKEYLLVSIKRKISLSQPHFQQP